MNNDFLPSSGGKEYLRKCCEVKLNHKIIYTSSINHDEVQQFDLILSLDKLSVARFVWSPNHKILNVYKNNTHTTNIPYFEPQLNNLKALKDKLKLYLLFL